MECRAVDEDKSTCMNTGNYALLTAAWVYRAPPVHTAVYIADVGTDQ